MYQPTVTSFKNTLKTILAIYLYNIVFKIYFDIKKLTIFSFSTVQALYCTFQLAGSLSSMLQILASMIPPHSDPHSGWQELFTSSFSFLLAGSLQTIFLILTIPISKHCVPYFNYQHPFTLCPHFLYSRISSHCPLYPPSRFIYSMFLFLLVLYLQTILNILTNRITHDNVSNSC